MAVNRSALGLGIYLAFIAVLCAWLLISFWPVKAKSEAGSNGNAAWEETVELIGGIETEVRYEVRLIVVAMLSGALGAFVHAATSFASYVGNRNLAPSWNWWFVLRPLIGMVLAVLFYFLIRGGLVTYEANGGSINPFGVAAIAGLAGMFSKQAIDKMREVFDNLFKTEDDKGDKMRGDKLNNGSQDEGNSGEEPGNRKAKKQSRG